MRVGCLNATAATAATAAATRDETLVEFERTANKGHDCRRITGNDEVLLLSVLLTVTIYCLQV